MSTDDILRNALHAAADVADQIHGHEVGDSYRKFADENYSNRQKPCPECGFVRYRNEKEYHSLECSRARVDALRLVPKP